MKFKIFLATLILIITPLVSFAQIPFGGKILATYECGCSGGWLIYFYDLVTKAPIPIVFQFGTSRLNQNFNIFTPNTNILGSNVPGGVCSVYTSSCSPVPVVGTVTPPPLPGIGTSGF